MCVCVPVCVCACVCVCMCVHGASFCMFVVRLWDGIVLSILQELSVGGI